MRQPPSARDTPFTVIGWSASGENAFTTSGGVEGLLQAPSPSATNRTAAKAHAVRGVVIRDTIAEAGPALEGIAPDGRRRPRAVPCPLRAPGPSAPMGSMPTVLGVNCAYHESSACLLKDGKIVAAVEEERFNRVKHAKHSLVDNADELPVESIAYVLRAAGVQAADVEHVGLTLDPDKRLAANRDLREPGIPAGDFGTPDGEETFARHVRRSGELLRAQFPRAEVHFLAHHLCHAASTFYPSRHERAAVLAVDGIGEFCSTWLGVGEGNELRTLVEIGYPSSLGFLWEKMSEHLGFDLYGGPGKMMGYGCITDPLGETSGVDYAERLRR